MAEQDQSHLDFPYGNYPHAVMLRAHVDRFGVAPDGRVFRNAAGGYADAGACGITRARARAATLTREEQVLMLANGRIPSRCR